MKFLAVAALLVAGVLAVPTPNSCSTPGGQDPHPPAHPPANNGGGSYSPPSDGGSTTPHHGGDGVNNNGDGNDGNGGNGDGDICPPGLLYSNPQCCAADVLGVVDLDCVVPSNLPSDTEDFETICAKDGRKAQCCAIPVVGQALLCQNVPGGN